MSHDTTPNSVGGQDASPEITRHLHWSDFNKSTHHEAVCDIEEVRRAILVIFAPGELHELRAIPSGRGQIVSADLLDAACAAVQTVCDQTVYYSLNPIRQGAERANTKTVLSRRWLLIDIDPVRPSDVSATGPEKDFASELMSAVLGYLAVLGWPMPVLVDSGNGFHLLYRIDLPNDALTHQIIKQCLEHLAAKHDTAEAKIDTAVHDAPRIAKMPGTWARKGISTPERPHRICRLIEVPENIEIVPIDKLQAIGQPSKKNATSEGPFWSDFAGKGGQGLEKYIQSAIEREGYRILSATEGSRNVALNRAAFAIGTMASWPEMNIEGAKAHLIRDGERAGLEPRECLLTVNSGWTAGEKDPRQRPTDPQRNGKHEEPAGSKLKYVTKKLSEYHSVEIVWLDPYRIAIGFITIFAGKTSIGKSFVAYDYIARFTTGRELPDGPNHNAPFDVILISEDPIEQLMHPRMMAMKADTTRIHTFTWESMAEYTLDNTSLLERAYEESNTPRLLVVDPPTNFLPEKIDEHKNSAIRQMLMKVVAWINSKNMACVMITHVNKQGGKGIDAIFRIMGSAAWGTTPRLAMAFAEDNKKRDVYLYACVKSNISIKSETLAYELVPAEQPRTINTQGLVKWIGKVDITAEQAFENAGRDSVGESIEAWMEERFREKRIWPADTIKDFAMVSGFSFNAYKTYKKGIKKKQIPDENGVVKWFWEAMYGWPPEKQPTSQTKSPESPESPESGKISINHESSYADSGEDKFIRTAEPGAGSDTREPGSDDERDPNLRNYVAAQTVSRADSGDSSDSSGFKPEVISAIRWLSGILGKTPISVLQIEELGNKLLIDPETLRKAAEVLRVDRTIDNNLESWSLG